MSRPAPRLFSVREVADLLGLSTKTVYKYIADGELRVVQMSTRNAKERITIRVREDDLAKFIDKRTAKSA